MPRAAPDRRPELVRPAVAGTSAPGRPVDVARQTSEPSRSPDSIRTPRAQSAAGISFLPCARTRPRRTGEVAVPAYTAFSGPRAALYRANLYSRCASRVLRVLGDYPCGSPTDLYEAVRALPWEDFVTPEGTLAVSAIGEAPGLSNSMFTALKTKDAVVDRFRDRLGRRPDVDPQRPDLRINVQLYDGGKGPRCLLSLDSSDPPLYQRGYRQQGGPAPLKETLAAAIIAQTGEPALGSAPIAEAVHTALPNQQRPSAIVDLCCGSGTLLTEAGLSMLRVAPGLGRSFGFTRWRDFDAGLWRTLLAEAKAKVRSASEVFLYGSDIDPRALRSASQNLQSAGLYRYARLSRCDLRTAEPPSGQPGIVLCNPPYGERMGDERDLIDLYRGLGDTLKRRFSGYRAYVYTANLALARQIGLRPSARHVLWNGVLEGRLLRFDLY